jgi:hypothetical protein
MLPHYIGLHGTHQRTRGEEGDLGGLAIRMELVLESLPELAPALGGLSDAHNAWYAARLRAGIRPTPFQAPPLSAYVIDRSQGVALKKHLLAADSRHAGVLAITALQGMGGIGKTTLAAAIAADFDVRGRFPDGILWATLGHDPQLDRIIETWLTALGGISSQDRNSNVAQLRTLLRDRACLLIVDDLWEKEHAEPLLAGGEQCRVLLTTRRAIAADELGARPTLHWASRHAPPPLRVSAALAASCQGHRTGYGLPLRRLSSPGKQRLISALPRRHPR